MELKKEIIDVITIWTIGAILGLIAFCFVFLGIYSWVINAEVRTDFILMVLTGIVLLATYILFMGRWMLSRIREIKVRYGDNPSASELPYKRIPRPPSKTMKDLLFETED